MKTELELQMERMHQMNVLVAEAQAKKALGDAVVTVLALGQPLSVDALLAQLLGPVQYRPLDDLMRMTHESAAHLLGWVPWKQVPLPPKTTASP